VRASPAGSSLRSNSLRPNGIEARTHEKLIVYADLRVDQGGRVVTVSPGLEAGPGGSVPIPVDIPGVDVVHAARIDADQGRVALALPHGTSTTVAILEFSTKPLVNLVWIGALLALLGTALAGLRRALEARPARRGVPSPSLGPEVAPTVR
jgi:hypothetical protein